MEQAKDAEVFALGCFMVQINRQKSYGFNMVQLTPGVVTIAPHVGSIVTAEAKILK